MGERAKFESNIDAQQYGRYYWAVELAAGGRVTVHANRVEVTDGLLVFYGVGHELAGGGRADYDSPKGAEYPVIGFGFGEWRTFYAAGIVDGAPVAVDRWVEATDGD